MLFVRIYVPFWFGRGSGAHAWHGMAANLGLPCSLHRLTFLTSSPASTPWYIPRNLVAQAAPAAAAQPAAPQAGAMETLDDFRGHPQFNDLKRLVQRDPAMLSNVLQMIGQQSPTLLARIHENQGEFIALMNEPVDESAPPAAAAAPAGGMGALGSMMG